MSFLSSVPVNNEDLKVVFLVNRTVAQKLCETSGLVVEMACCEPCEVAARVHTAAVIEMKRMDNGLFVLTFSRPLFTIFYFQSYKRSFN